MSRLGGGGGGTDDLEQVDRCYRRRPESAKALRCSIHLCAAATARATGEAAICNSAWPD